MVGSARRPKRAHVRAGIAAVIAACGALALMLVQLPAGAQTLTDPATPVTGNATYFDGLGSPYGGCGLPQDRLDTQNFVALNVYNTPGDYTFYKRPLAGADAAKVGMWNNGLNCGRWVQVSISDYCTGTNDGAANKAFCRNGAWATDKYNGATLMMQVADSCGDDNGWCRDDPYHLDLSKDSLTQFVKNGAVVADMYPNHWNNRHITWKFAPAPDYTGDIAVGFMGGAQVWWPAIAVSHLANGIHSVEYSNGGVWKTAKMNGDMGQSYIIDGLTSGANKFQIRVRDVNDKLINGGRVYSFALPTTCGANCAAAYTAVKYTTSGGSAAVPSAPVSGAPVDLPSSALPSGTAAADPPSVTPPSDVLPSVTPPPADLPSGTPPLAASPSDAPPVAVPASAGCTATATVNTTWQGGFQSMVTVKAGSTPITGWSVQWSFGNGEKVAQLWSATYTVSGSTVSARNVAWNGTLAANTSASFGFAATGTPKPITVRCASA